MIAKKRTRTSRCSRGATLTEMLIASLLLGFSLAAIGEVMVVTAMSTNKLTNRASGIADSRSVTRRIQADIREARNFGDAYDIPEDNSSLYENNYFPCSDNPLYEIGSGPQHISTRWSWNGWPTNWGTPPYKLDAQTLIIQQPVVFLDPANDPLDSSFSASAPQNNLNGLPIEGSITAGRNNLETIVYKLIQDPNEPTEFILQRARFSGEDPVSQSSYKAMINPPQTVLTGIIGPLPTNGGTTPEIFTFFTKGAIAGQFDEIDPANLDTNPSITNNIIGAGLDIELKKPDSSNGQANTAYQQRMGIHTEAFTRYNRGLSAKN